MSESIPNGGPAYPLATPGVRLELNPASWLTFRTAIFQGNPAAEDVNRQGFHYNFSSRSGALFLNELETRWEGIGSAALPGSFKTGAWFHTANFEDPADDDILRRGNRGFYFILDQKLFRPGRPNASAPTVWSKADGKTQVAFDDKAEDCGVGLGSFARIGFQPADRNELSFYADGGLTYQGLIPGRENDTLGVAVAYGKLSRGAARALADDGARNPGYEIALEATYQVQVTPWFVVQPNIQTIIRPGGTADFGNALVLGVRSSIEF